MGRGWECLRQQQPCIKKLKPQETRVVCNGLAEELIKEALAGHDNVRNYDRVACVFDSDTEELPALGLYESLKRWVRYSRCGAEVVVTSAIFLRRCRIGKTPLNIHRLLFAALLAAIKYSEDSCHANSYYASIFGLPLATVNSMENLFLRDVDFQLTVSPQEYRSTLSRLLSLGDRRQKEKREEGSIRRSDGMLSAANVPILAVTIATTALSLYTAVGMLGA
eukprot:TRINITY_DN13196_c2_g1_i1.p1 TRINITY_DN13196_c2_g1~~TRINITY_DN13196_c2_g1_i1.p1  ORF type:complete len:247 (+),score=39.55 TRINITY_DN13196_c2_g1_i1:78-743(+)